MHRTFIIIIIVVAYSRRGPSRRCTTMSTVDSIQRSPNTEMRRRDRRRNSEVRPVRCSTSSFWTRSYHRIPSSCLIRHFWWKASRVLTSADSKVQVSAAYSNTDKTSVECQPLVAPYPSWLHRQGRYGVLGLDDTDHPMTINCQGEQSCRLIDWWNITQQTL